MDRPLIEVGELPCAEDFLGLAKDALYGFGMMASAAIGPNTGVAGLAIAPTIPASLAFTIGAGSIYEPETVDATAYGVLGTDANTIIKQGILATPVTLTVTPPSTSGFSQVYIVQIGYSDVDNGAALVPFFNSADPTHPSSSTQNTIRQGALIVELKAGTAAPTGSQATPTPDPGFTAIWAITVANGATTITSAQWVQLSANGAPLGAPWFPNLESLYSLFVPVVPTTTFYVNNSTGDDTTGNGTSTYPWASITHALLELSAYNLNGSTVTIQLGLTGVAYTMPSSFVSPSNGTLVIQGNSSAQASYIITGAPPPNLAVVDIQGGSVQLIGLTVKYTGGGGACVVAANANVLLTDVTLVTTVAGASSLLFASSGSVCTIGANVLFNGNASSAIAGAFGGIVQQAANSGCTSSPAFTQFASFSQGGIFTVTATGFAWGGSGVTGARFSIASGGGANTDGAGVNFFLGSTAGTVTSPGWYV